MPHLLDLPPEVLLIILKFFEPAQYASVLLSVCLVSRRLCTLAQPLLFTENIREAHCHHSCQLCSPKPGCLGTLLYFTRTILSRSNLGACVRRLFIDTSEGERREPQEWSEVLTLDTIKLLASGVQALPIGNKARMLLGMVGTRMNPLLVLLVSRTPKLEHLEIILGSEGLCELTPLVTPTPGVRIGSPYLSNLKFLHIRCISKGTDNTFIKNLSHFLRLPRLDDFSITFFNGTHLSDTEFEFLPDSLNLSSISFYKTCLGSSYLSKIIDACKCLKRFTYETLCSSEHGHNPYQHEPADLVSILFPHRHNLEMIRIDLHMTDPYCPLWEHPKYDSFARFTRLRGLEVEHCLLHEIPELPNSLETLIIRGCEYPVSNMLTSLARQSQESLENLEMVILQPLSSPPNGLLGLSRTFTSDDLSNNPIYRASFKRACEKLDIITNDAFFDFYIMGGEWDDYQMGII